MALKTLLPFNWNFHVGGAYVRLKGPAWRKKDTSGTFFPCFSENTWAVRKRNRLVIHLEKIKEGQEMVILMHCLAEESSAGEHRQSSRNPGTYAGPSQLSCPAFKLLYAPVTQCCSHVCRFFHLVSSHLHAPTGNVWMTVSDS